MLSLEYIAGFFDGEGSIGIYSNSGRKESVGWNLRTQLVQNVSPESEAILDELVQRYGGNVTYRDRGRRCANWQCGGQNALHFLSEILPHLVLKREQAEFAIQWQLGRPHPTRDERGRIQPLPDWYQEYAIAGRDRLKAMKRES